MEEIQLEDAKFEDAKLAELSRWTSRRGPEIKSTIWVHNHKFRYGLSGQRSKSKSREDQVSETKTRELHRKRFC